MQRQRELAINVRTYVQALAYSHHVDEQDLFIAVAGMATAEAHRLEGLDPQRNK